MNDIQGFRPIASERAIHVRGAFVKRRSVWKAFEADMLDKIQTTVYLGEGKSIQLDIQKSVKTEDCTLYVYDEQTYASETHGWLDKFTQKNVDKIRFYRQYNLHSDHKKLCKHTSIAVCFTFVREIATENPYQDGAAKRISQDVTCHTQLATSSLGNLIAPFLPIRNGVVDNTIDSDPFVFYNIVSFDSPLACYPYFFARARPMYANNLQHLLNTRNFSCTEIALKVSMLATRLFMTHLFVSEEFNPDEIVYWFDVDDNVQLTHFTSRESPCYHTDSEAKEFWRTLAYTLQVVCKTPKTEKCMPTIMTNLRQTLNPQRDALLTHTLDFVETAHEWVSQTEAYVNMFDGFLVRALRSSGPFLRT
ncbi:hypothetical protein CYMTET_44627 [Cymbomonas tetramitiformis]|uniref:Uncharacterized protein n=1 Tax=Cymbomonas tetramitiformis TaxID=36881 RepID=A0AAE0BZS9_9CHLO|nr:hypothetical protein CYMTET_44627 [Cymbomonas tetramitiformis]